MNDKLAVTSEELADLANMVASRWLRNGLPAVKESQFNVLPLGSYSEKVVALARNEVVFVAVRLLAVAYRRAGCPLDRAVYCACRDFLQAITPRKSKP